MADESIMSKEHWWIHTGREKLKYFVDKPVPETIFPPQTPHQLVASNPEPRGERLASTNRTSPERGHKYRSVL